MHAQYLIIITGHHFEIHGIRGIHTTEKAKSGSSEKYPM